MAGAHLALFGLVKGSTPEAAPGFDPPIFVELTRPWPPEPPPQPAETTGGGAPAAASRVHEPPPLPTSAPPSPFTPADAPVPTLIVGAAETPSDAPAAGLGGQGTGQGDGVGSGVGPGSGVERARLVSAPDARVLAALHPDGPRSRRAGRGEARCTVRADMRLEACRIISESPSGAGFGQAALSAAAYYRFRPYMRDGRPESGEIVILVEFGRP